ncbi:unnamed protein product [Peniophora sp. CBMAI 1063]|nr:unnamed protein product [Peniophora sp. CBMAI 1063]
MLRVVFFALLLIAGSASAITIKFVNKCDHPVWAAIAAAPNGVPNPNISWGKKLTHGEHASHKVSDTAIGVRSWGRTGCNENGGNCKTGACNGGLKCTDGGITAGVILGEYGHADFGACCGGKRTSWDLSIVDSGLNMPTKLHSSDGQSVACTKKPCNPDKVYTYATDYAADRNSKLGATYTHTFCP